LPDDSGGAECFIPLDRARRVDSVDQVLAVERRQVHRHVAGHILDVELAGHLA
jgi:hypothetical protein